MKNKTLKPIEIDAQFKYRCANSECGNEYWVFLNQAKVKGFKIVCDCGAVYKTRTIDKVFVKYLKNKNNKPQTSITNNAKTVSDTDAPYIDKACQVLLNYGFSDKEAKELVHKVHDITQCQDPILLVKDALRVFGGI